MSVDEQLPYSLHESYSDPEAEARDGPMYSFSNTEMDCEDDAPEQDEDRFLLEGEGEGVETSLDRDFEDNMNDEMSIDELMWMPLGDDNLDAMAEAWDGPMHSFSDTEMVWKDHVPEQDEDRFLLEASGSEADVSVDGDFEDIMKDLQQEAFARDDEEEECGTQCYVANSAVAKNVSTGPDQGARGGELEADHPFSERGEAASEIVGCSKAHMSQFNDHACVMAMEAIGSCKRPLPSDADDGAGQGTLKKPVPLTSEPECLSYPDLRFSICGFEIHLAADLHADAEAAGNANRATAPGRRAGEAVVLVKPHIAVWNAAAMMVGIFSYDLYPTEHAQRQPGFSRVVDVSKMVDRPEPSHEAYYVLAMEDGAVVARSSRRIKAAAEAWRTQGAHSFKVVDFYGRRHTEDISDAEVALLRLLMVRNRNDDATRARMEELFGFECDSERHGSLSHLEPAKQDEDPFAAFIKEVENRRSLAIRKKQHIKEQGFPRKECTAKNNEVRTSFKTEVHVAYRRCLEGFFVSLMPLAVSSGLAE